MHAFSNNNIYSVLQSQKGCFEPRMAMIILHYQFLSIHIFSFFLYFLYMSSQAIVLRGTETLSASWLVDMVHLHVHSARCSIS